MSAAEILAAIKRWHARYGEPPTMADWDPYRARQIDQEWRIARYDEGDWPSVKTVRNHFGRLSDAVAAAGLVPRHQGQHQPRTELVLDSEVLLHIATLRSLQDRRPTPSVLAAQVREVARAQGSADPSDLRLALIELAAAALRWADIASPAEAVS